MKHFLLLFMAWCLTSPCITQTTQRISIASITPGVNTGQDYSPWMNDNTDSLVANAGGNNAKYIDVKLQLASRSLVSKLTFFDDAGVFTTNPAYIYALDGNEKIYLGKFEGLVYKNFVDLNLQYPLLADAIIIHKYSNNIPQKVQVYGVPYIPGTTILPEIRLTFDSAIASANTGQNFNLWFTDDMYNGVEWGYGDMYSDVTLTLHQRCKVYRLAFWDMEAVFTSAPAYFYALKDTQKTFLGIFEGLTYQNWVTLPSPVPVIADAIFVHKFGGYIPKKVWAYGIPLLADPLDTLLPSKGRLPIVSITPAIVNGMNVGSWLSDNIDSLIVFSNNAQNFQYSDIALHLKGKSKIGRLSLMNDTAAFSGQPALFYGVNNSDTSFIGSFTGAADGNFVDIMPVDSVLASTIIVRKYGNNIPHKIKIYGRQLDTLVTTPPIDSAQIVKIPIDPKRWYILNNVNDVIYKLFDGSNENVYGGYGRIITNYDAYYPLKKGEHIDLTSIRFYDGEGMLGDDQPVTLSVINELGQNIPVATFNGSRYNSWVGPYPNRETTEANKFKLDSNITNIRFLVLNFWHGYPGEIELYGKYKAGIIDAQAPPAKSVPFKAMAGINAFEWDFESPYDPMKIDSASYAGVKNFTGVRHYMDWEKLESHEGSYTYSPVHSGGWNYDAIYEKCKADGIEVLACLKTIPSWMQDTYPNQDRDAENVPVTYGSNFSSPLSYMRQAKMGFQYIARYGSNTGVNPALLSVNSQPRWNHDDTNVVKIGLGLIKYIECDNERDKWWKGRRAYQTSYEYAANLSAFYDGHMNTMGPGVGVKNADSTVKVVMGGLAAPDPSYVRGMIEWCKINRGYKPDSSVNLCWDIINYHLYSNDAQSSQNGYSTRGAAPEKSEATTVARAFRKLAHEEANDMPVWVSEVGYDENQGSPLKAIAIGNKTVLQTQADWNLRSALLYAREGIEKVFFYQLYDDNPTIPMQFGSMGFLNSNRSRKLAADYLVQTNKLIGNYIYKETIHNDPLVDRYETDGKNAYVLMIPDETGRTASYNLDLGNADSVKVCTLLAGSDTMLVQYMTTNNGMLNITVTETPVFVLPITFSPATHRISAINGLQSGAVSNALSVIYGSDTATSMMQVTTINNDNSKPPANTAISVSKELLKIAGKLNIYPNPVHSTLIVSFEGSLYYTSEIKIIATSSGKTVMNVKVSKMDGPFTKQINLSNLPTGMYELQLKQGNTLQYRSFIKTEN